MSRGRSETLLEEQKVRFDMITIFQKFLKNPLTNFKTSAIIKYVRMRELVRGSAEPSADGFSEKTLKNLLTNPKKHAIISM